MSEPHTTTPPGRGERSQEALQDRIVDAVLDGAHPKAIARHQMLRPDRIRRWLCEDTGFRARAAAAVALRNQELAEEMIAEADRDAAYARGRRRIAAIRRQIVARRYWVKLINENAQDIEWEDEDGVDATDDAVAGAAADAAAEPAEAKTAGAAAEVNPAPAASAAPSSTFAMSPANTANSEEKHTSDVDPVVVAAAEATTSSNVSTSPANAAREPAFLSPSSRAEITSSSRHPREGGDPRVSVLDVKQHVDARHEAGHDEQQAADIDTVVVAAAEATTSSNLSTWLANGVDGEETQASAIDAFVFRHPRAPLFEGPRASGPIGGDPEQQTEELDARFRGHDEQGIPDDSDDETPAYAPEDARYRRTPPADGQPEPPTDSPNATPSADTPNEQPASADSPHQPPPAPGKSPIDEDDEPQYHRLPLSVGEEEALRARGIEPPPYRPVRLYDDDEEPRYHRLPLSVAEEEALKARLAGKPLPPVAKKREWKPDTPLYVRFDVGGGFDVSNQRDRHDRTDWSDYDPLAH